ncbi:type I-E CRISPR-associated protein Cse1/CasA [Saccharopolyspora gregorii]|uniref:Type I-E CRISPR-associated protein Cse1/CasA n=1 Tax=Saccharopolyspora gregorii TaxID=33914 RepID=A0ABP6RNE5_9PSEU
MTRPSFDLSTEPWIPVVDREGVSRTLSIIDVFRRAHDLRWIDAEAPPVTAALHRLLLAVLHAGLGGPRDRKAWGSLWKAPELPAELVRKYIESMPGAFDLFDVERPFLQCPALETVDVRPVAQLVQFRAVGSNLTLFDHTTAGDRLALTPAEAARWLVAVQCYDPGGTKTPYEKVKNSSAGLGNRFGVVMAEGSTVKETLLLNAHCYDPEYEIPRSSTHDDLPAWEAGPPNPRPEERAPHGWLDLLTWPARRVLLHPSTESGDCTVNGVVITPGVTLKNELRQVELMAAFEKPPSKSKKDDQPWNPVRLHELRGVWRHARKLLLAEDTRQHERPKILDHVSDQIEWGTLPVDAVFTIRVFGQQLDDSGGGSVYAWLQEQLPAPAALLTNRQPWLGEVLGSCVALADNLGRALDQFANECRKAFHAEHSTDAKRRAKHNFGLTQAYWPTLPAEFATLLRALGTVVVDRSPAKPPINAWRDIVRSTAEEAVDRAVAQLRDRQARHLAEIAAAYEEFRKSVLHHRRTFDAQIGSHLL